jgi:hypothetical protein
MRNETELEERKPLTWQQLKDFANSLPPEELTKNVVWWGEEEGGEVWSAYQLEEDYCTTDYAVEPVSVQEYSEDEEPYEIDFPKGTPIITTV